MAVLCLLAPQQGGAKGRHREFCWCMTAIVDDVCERPIFIIGTERSGSNLLRLVLNAHSRLFIPHPPHVMHLLKPLESSYGDLRRNQPFHALAADVCALVRNHTFPWDFEPQVDDVVAACRERSLFGVYAAVHELYRRRRAKARWGCKSTFMLWESDAILHVFAAAQFIHLVRDPRDVAVSARQSVFNDFHPWWVAQRWAREQQRALHLSETLGGNRLHRVHYEALVARPEETIGQLCEFLREPFEPTMLGFFRTYDARRSAALCADWRNTDRGFIATNTGKFEAALSAEEVAMIEAVAEPQMRVLGYVSTTSDEARSRALLAGPWARFRYFVSDRVQKLRVEWNSVRRDRNRWLRVRKGLLLRWLRLKATLRRSFGVRF